MRNTPTTMLVGDLTQPRLTSPLSIEILIYFPVFITLGGYGALLFTAPGMVVITALGDGVGTTLDLAGDRPIGDGDTLIITGALGITHFMVAWLIILPIIIIDTQ